jgi:hypothetical protein
MAQARTTEAPENVNIEEPVAEVAQQAESVAASPAVGADIPLVPAAATEQTATEPPDNKAKANGKAGKRKAEAEPEKKQDKDYQQLSFF